MSGTSLNFVHFTDTHIQPEGATPIMGQNTYQQLRNALDLVYKLEIKPDFYVISGDLVHETQEDGYERLKILVDEMRGTTDTPVFLAMGNHDIRKPFRHVFLNDTTTDETVSYYYSQMVGGLRVIVLDTKTNGSHEGTIEDEQYKWLANELAQPAPQGNLLVMHHPVGPMILKGHLMNDREKFLAAIEGQPIVGILSGHTHFHNITNLHNIPSVTGAGVAFTLDPFAKTGMRLTNGSGFVVGNLQDRNLITMPIVMPSDQQEIMFMPFDKLAELTK